MADQYNQNNKISVRMDNRDLEILDKLCKFYKKRRSDVIRGTITARYNSLVKKGEIG